MVEKWIAAGVEKCRAGKFEEGVAAFDKALAQSPNHLEGLANRARALSRVGRLEDSLADFEQLVALQPANAQFVGDMAVALHLNERNEEAATAFDKALALEPQNPYRYSSRAFFKDRIGDYEGAIADYEKCIAMDPEDAIALNNKGLVEEKLGYKERSKKSFDRSNQALGYKPRENFNDQSPKSKSEEPSITSEIVNPKSPETRWEVVKTLFTKEGFKDFVSFSGGLLRGKKD